MVAARKNYLQHLSLLFSLQQSELFTEAQSLSVYLLRLRSTCATTAAQICACVAGLCITHFIPALRHCCPVLCDVSAVKPTIGEQSARRACLSADVAAMHS
jgi:precorrin isomerase